MEVQEEAVYRELGKAWWEWTTYASSSTSIISPSTSIFFKWREYPLWKVWREWGKIKEDKRWKWEKRDGERRSDSSCTSTSMTTSSIFIIAGSTILPAMCFENVFFFFFFVVAMKSGWRLMEDIMVKMVLKLLYNVRGEQ